MSATPSSLLGGFWGGVLASIVAAVVVGMAIWLFRSFSKGAKSILHSRKLAMALQSAGVSGFFPDRTCYVKDPCHGDISTYIRSARSNLSYAGLWLSHATEQGNIILAIEELLNRGCRVELSLLDSEIDDSFIALMADYLEMTAVGLRARLRESWEYLTRNRERLSDRVRENFVIKKHQTLTTASAFMFDVGHPEAKTLVDFKFFRAGRDKSAGIEIRRGTGSQLYDTVTSSFQAIVRGAKIAAQHGVAPDGRSPVAPARR